MKKTIAALACASTFFATSAMAGGMSDPVVEPEIVIEDTATGTSANGAILVLLSFLTFAAVAAN